jgi:hypothetical protein
MVGIRTAMAQTIPNTAMISVWIDGIIAASLAAAIFDIINAKGFDRNMNAKIIENV